MRGPAFQLVSFSLLTALLCNGCTEQRFQLPSSTPAVSVQAKIAVRYAELTARGTPEQICEEFSREELIRHAEYLFEHAVFHGNLWLYSDTPYDSAKGRQILQEAERRLSASPLYDATVSHRGFICNTAWRSEYFLQGKDKYGGLNYFHVAPHVFFAKSRVEDDATLSPQNRPIAAPRTLTYYVVHEFTHSMVSQAVKEKGWSPPPKWLSEGYPDFVALGPGFSYESALSSYRNRDPRVHRTMAEEYLQYDLLAAYYLEREGRSVDDLFANPPTLAKALSQSLPEDQK